MIDTFKSQNPDPWILASKMFSLLGLKLKDKKLNFNIGDFLQLSQKLNYRLAKNKNSSKFVPKAQNNGFKNLEEKFIIETILIIKYIISNMQPPHILLQK